NRKGNVTRLTDVNDPVIICYPAPSNNNTGKAIIVCPGGGFSILAIDKEGYEIAEWLNTLGINAFVLQYRVPDKQAGALQDVQRAIRLVRYNAGEWHLNRENIGIIGFSAGGSLAARLSTIGQLNTYENIDQADDESYKPDFALLIYAAYLDKGTERSLSPELIVDENTPPMFLFGTADDPYSNSLLVMAGALRDAKVPFELHILPDGGHGYGLRSGINAAETWPKLAKNWLGNMK
ncbi:MAG: alpha/beta hydrolase, partial [Bacteroidetes bacterium]